MAAATGTPNRHTVTETVSVHGPGRAGGDGSRTGPGAGEGHTHKRGEGIEIGLTFGVALPANEPKPTAATSWARTAARRCSTIGELGVSFDTVRNPASMGCCHGNWLVSAAGGE